MISLLSLFAPQTAFMQAIPDSSTTNSERIELKQEVLNPDAKNATFIQTLLRTPFAIMTAVITFICVVMVGFFEFFGYLFTGFNYHFPVTQEIMSMGWKGIVADWWWHPALTWHLIVSLIIFAGIGGGSRR